MPTPEEYYRRAYDRAIALAEACLTSIPKPRYEINKEITFEFDPKAKYFWAGATPDGGDVFMRKSDNHLAKFTKYSHIILK